MDSFCNDSQGFLNLLASQTSQTIDLGETELPSVSSQTTEEQKGVQRRIWTPREDVVLISAWLNTSKDPVVANEQKAGAFWKRIVNYFNASPQVNDLPPREWSHCKQRWGRINELVCKFVGAYEAALKEQSSGQSENDVMKAAHDIFLNDHGSKFTLDHAWRQLRFNQKWSSTYLSKEGAKDKRKEATDTETSEVASEPRPEGIKAAKAAKRKKHGPEATMEKLENISKHKILDRLLASSGTLSEIEVSLKNKLINELLGICDTS